MNSPEPALSSSAQVGNILVSFAGPKAAADEAAASDRPPLFLAANDESPPSSTAPGYRIPLTMWLAVVFWALGTALLLIMGAAYRLLLG